MDVRFGPFAAIPRDCDIVIPREVTAGAFRTMLRE